MQIKYILDLHYRIQRIALVESDSAGNSSEGFGMLANFSMKLKGQSPPDPKHSYNL